MRALAHLVLVALLMGALLGAACKTYGDDPEPPAPAGSPGVDPRLVIAVDRRVELMSIVARLAEYEEYAEPASTPYARAVDAHFATWRAHPVVAQMRGLRQSHGLGYNAVVGFGIYLDEALQPLRPLRAPLPGLDPRWNSVDLDAFLFELQDFATVSGYGAFFAAQAPYFAKVEARVRGALDGYRIVDWFEAMFGARAATFHVAPGLLTGNHAYGQFAVDTAGNEHIFQVLYLPPGRADGLPHPDRATIYTLIHEFAHSYVNPALDARQDVYVGALQPLFDRYKVVMEKQKYGAINTVANESVVRALVVLYARDRGARGAEARRVAGELRAAFFWTPQVVDAVDAARAKHGGALSADDLAAAARDAFAAYHAAHP
ncbi:MAG TPA: DUF4932 domain-containing protein [Kofleriaceae bacterium]|nr:DUF4932 domain-containing protein [Kofleriaceae bacterium]